MNDLYLKRLDSSPVGGNPDNPRISAKECAELCERAGIKYSDGDEKRVLEFDISDDIQDHDDDVMLQEGWDFSEYKTNPLVLFQHDRQKPPLGSTIDLRLKEFQRPYRNVAARTQKKTSALALYDGNKDNQLAQVVFSLASKGMMRGASVGFRLKEGMNSIQVIYDDLALREQWAMDRPGKLIKSMVLKEWSNVNIPANARALRVAMAGQSAQEFAKSLKAEVFGLDASSFALQKAVSIGGYEARPADEVEAAYLKSVFAQQVADPLDPINAPTKAFLLSRGVPCGAEAKDVEQILGDLGIHPKGESDDPQKSVERLSASIVKAVLPRVEQDIKRLLAPIEESARKAEARAKALEDGTATVVEAADALKKQAESLQTLLVAQPLTPSQEKSETDDLSSEDLEASAALFEALVSSTSGNGSSKPA